jgi:hypothetical protein
MASAINQAVLRRLADEGRAPAGLDGDGRYASPVRGTDGWRLEERDTRPQERPPMAEVLAASAA